jgi:hypothetical protein
MSESMQLNSETHVLLLGLEYVLQWPSVALSALVSAQQHVKHD